MAQARLTANPGCYPTSVILAMYPALEGGYISGKIIADSKSGVSGAGRSASVGTLFCEVADSFKAYSTAKHRHTPEMEQELSRAVNRPVALSFSPHLVPMSRGILSTCYADLAGKAQEAEIREFYKSFYKDHPWVRIMPQARLPETRWVKGTMYCDLGLVVDQRTNTLVVVSCIDNLCRGASGQAVANANIMCGYQPGLGLDHLPLVP
ncbi:MAG: N-acetyl-gamma-glutamyl-phosphate reductase, partial [Desulfonatronovibrionaceae bacterium]